MSGEHSDALISRQVRDLETLLEERGVLGGHALDEALDAYLRRATPANGRRIVAHAWLDDGFRERLLENANVAIEELGFSMGGGIQEQRLRGRTPRKSTTSWCVRSAPAIRSRCSALRRAGTKARRTGPEWCAIREQCWPSSA